MSVHAVDNVRLIISEARSANIKSVIVSFTKDDAQNCLSAVSLLQLYFDHLHIMKDHIINTVLDIVHKAITCLKFNRRILQNKLDWKDWLAAEWKQLGKYANQIMYGPLCTAPVDESIFLWVWLYSIKPHDNKCKKVRGICDGSNHGGQTIVHSATYAPTPQHIYVRTQIALLALLGMHL
jgi:hypothetical protein